MKSPRDACARPRKLTAVLAELGCKLIKEDKSFSKKRIDYVFRAPRNSTQEGLHKAFCERVPADVRGEIDWEIE